MELWKKGDVKQTFKKNDFFLFFLVTSQISD